MRRDELAELHYIAPIKNVPSILNRGILSHRLADKVSHQSVAMQEIQARRTVKMLPTGRNLHEYVNLYFHARNPMMFKRKDLHLALSVLRISTNVLDIPGTMVADRNASADWPRFDPWPAGILRLDRDIVFARDWRHPGDYAAYLWHRSVKCAEVLVPDRVEPQYIQGAYVSCQEASVSLKALAPALHVVIDADMFFR